MFRILLLLATSACIAQQPTNLGPSFGGDLSFHSASHSLDAGRLPPPESLTEAGLLSGLPLAIGQGPCPERACVSTRAAWTEGGLLIGLGIDGTPVRPPVELAFALDASGSVAGSEDVRAATVEIALEALRPDDRLAIWGFTAEVAELVPSGPVDAAHARRALAALDELPALDDLLREVPADSFEELLEALLEEEAEAIELVLLLIELTEDDPTLEEGLFILAQAPGSAVDLAAETVLESLPDGTEAAAARMVLVSDFDGPSALDPVSEAADRWVGTSLLGVTAGADQAEMNALASVPGAHTFDAPEPAAALAPWEQRFDALVAPNAWGITVDLAPASEQDWMLVRRFGGTDATGNLNAWFASEGHGILAVVLKPRRAKPSQPHFQLTLSTADEEITLEPWSRVPNRLVEEPWGDGDDLVALELAWRVALYDAVSNGDTEALALWADRPR